MTSKYKYFCVIFVLLCGMQWTACKQERQPCLTPKIAKMFLETMHKASDTATVFTDSALTSGVFIALTAGGADTFKYIGQSPVFNLSLSPDDSVCQWEFRTDTSSHTIFDTLTFHYERNLQFLSNACGFTYFYTLKAVQTTHTMIDSVHITNSSVTNNVNAAKHVQVYIHPDF